MASENAKKILDRKKWDALWDADKAIRRALNAGMEEGTKLTIQVNVGFEVCCYESWGLRYEVSGPIGPVGHEWPPSETVTASGCDLDAALARWIHNRDLRREQIKAESPNKEAQ